MRRSLFLMIAQAGSAGWYNPAWLFVLGFYKIFLRISQGASRLQEVLADRWAAFSYGSAAFEEGLRHVIERSLRFSAHTNATLQEVVEAERPLPNLYAYRPGLRPPEGEIEQRLEEELNAAPSPYDSHPAPAARIAWVRALAAQGVGSTPEDLAPAWELFSDREALERQMTAQVREALRQSRGIELPEEARPAA